MDQTTIVIVAAIAVVALLLLFLLRGRKQRVRFDAGAPLPRATAAPQAAAPAVPEAQSVAAGIGVTIEDAPAQPVEIAPRPAGDQLAAGGGDMLTMLKGLGPKAAARLRELGVTTFAQMAGWTETEIDAIDAQMGAFKGRIRRDRWVEQAQLLAKGDTDGFEAQFGKLGS